MTPGAVHDSTQFSTLISWVNRILDQKKVILTYDKTYYKIAKFDELCEAGYGFVTPLKANSLNRARNLRFEEYSQGEIRVIDQVVRLNTGRHDLRAVYLATGRESRYSAVLPGLLSRIRIGTNKLQEKVEFHLTRYSIDLVYG